MKILFLLKARIFVIASLNEFDKVILHAGHLKPGC
jgi:hypothetical protein